MTKLLFPANGAVLRVLNDLQRKFVNEETHYFNENKINWAHLVRYKEQDDTFPQPNTFKWETDEEHSVIEISETADFAEPRVEKVLGNEAQLHNFKANTTYYWRVNGSDAFTFKTEDVAPVFYDAEGISNVRDAGNWKTKYGCRIKQGLLFRGSEMNIHHTITEKGIDVMRNILKIKTDLDLRGEGFKFEHSPLGEDIRFLVIPCGPYKNFMNDKETCKKLFDVLADENNYPIYYHCWGGADRTGTLACMLGVALGMCEKDTLLDYEITSLSVWGDRNRVSDLYKSFLEELESYEGDTFEDKIMSFIYSCGITEQQLNKIRGILLDR
ncbi:MAG: tyrosine-protein phosphatase [Clostridia bacterium]|nr:tyrosine-protein phosphatase [Clostridia bacterium]